MLYIISKNVETKLIGEKKLVDNSHVHHFLNWHSFPYLEMFVNNAIRLNGEQFVISDNHFGLLHVINTNDVCKMEGMTCDWRDCSKYLLKGWAAN